MFDDDLALPMVAALSPSCVIINLFCGTKRKTTPPLARIHKTLNWHTRSCFENSW